MRHALKIVVVAAVLAIPSIATAAGPGHQTRAINCAREQYKPARIILTCGDAGIWLGKLSWSRWTRTTATATGTFNWNTCTPNCAAGHKVSRPVRVVLSGPKTCPGQAHPAFARGAFTFPSGGPPFRFRRTTFACPY